MIFCIRRITSTFFPPPGRFLACFVTTGLNSENELLILLSQWGHHRDRHLLTLNYSNTNASAVSSTDGMVDTIDKLCKRRDTSGARFLCFYISLSEILRYCLSGSMSVSRVPTWE